MPGPREKRIERDRERYWENPELACARTQDWRERNPHTVRAYRKRTYWERAAIINNFKDVPCVDCGIKYPPHAMDCDHVRGTKMRQGPAMFYAPLDELYAELAKCEVRCATCHRLRHGALAAARGGK